MNIKNNASVCASCGGILEKGKTTFTVDYGIGVVVVRNVPARICTQCGMEWIDDHYAEQIEEIVREAKTKHSEVEVLSLSA
jgi:YgiT-type zinc finger domain-containing protein